MTGSVFYRFQVGIVAQFHSPALCQPTRKIGPSCLVGDLLGKAWVEP
jgi:hypothetical protein